MKAKQLGMNRTPTGPKGYGFSLKLVDKAVSHIYNPHVLAKYRENMLHGMRTSGGTNIVATDEALARQEAEKEADTILADPIARRLFSKLNITTTDLVNVQLQLWREHRHQNREDRRQGLFDKVRNLIGAGGR